MPAPLSDRQRSSSLSDTVGGRTNGRVTSNPLDTPSLAASRRRSSGGVSSVLNGGKSGSAFGGLGRRDSSRAGASKTPPLNSSNQLGGGSGGFLPALRSFESYSTRNVAAALESGTEQIDDEWQQVCVKVLPLFNGEGIRGFVEDLNDLVLIHVQRTFTRYQSSSVRLRSQQPSVNISTLVTGLLTAELTDLIRLGCATLASKLAPPSPAFPLSNDRLLSRLNEIWLFFFTGILPHLEGVFWVLRCDDRLRATVGDTWQERQGRSRQEQAQGRIDIRRIALIEFRDAIVHPEIDRLEGLFEDLYRPRTGAASPAPIHPDDPSTASTSGDFASYNSARLRATSRSFSTATAAGLSPHSHPNPQRQYSSPSRLSPGPSTAPSPVFPPSNSLQTPLNPRFPLQMPNSPLSSAATSPILPPSSTMSSSVPAGKVQAFARRRQMVAILCGLLTEDERQEEMDSLLRLMRPSYYSRGGPATQDVPRGQQHSPEPIQVDEPPTSSFTTSPMMLDDLAMPTPGPVPQLPPAIPPVLTSRINARQRSRTMDSLDENDGEEVAGLLGDGGFVNVRPSPLSRHSTDGSRPSFTGSEPGEGGTAGEKGKKKARRRSFLPRIVRTNSQASNGTTGTGGDSTTEDDLPSPFASRSLSSPPLGLAIPSSVSLAGGSAGAAVAGDKLRRGLLRRNSSRKAVELAGTLGAIGGLGASSALALEDEED
ncbi:hypothetical protein JCM11251_007514 [Rhodosporidiobolus azoricus]